jgi:hypothetical protein
MPLNLSVRRASTILGGLALAAGAIVSTGPTALASTAKPSAATATCKYNGEEVESAAGGDVQLWYSPTCRTAWGVIEHRAAGSNVQVTNTDDVIAYAFVKVSGQRTVTAAIDDKDIQSLACAWTPDNNLIGCTAYF